MRKFAYTILVLLAAVYSDASESSGSIPKDCTKDMSTQATSSLTRAMANISTIVNQVVDNSPNANFDTILNYATNNLTASVNNMQCATNMKQFQVILKSNVITITRPLALTQLGSVNSTFTSVVNETMASFPRYDIRQVVQNVLSSLDTKYPLWMLVPTTSHYLRGKITQYITSTMRMVSQKPSNSTIPFTWRNTMGSRNENSDSDYDGNVVAKGVENFRNQTQFNGNRVMRNSSLEIEKFIGAPVNRTKDSQDDDAISKEKGKRFGPNLNFVAEYNGRRVNVTVNGTQALKQFKQASRDRPLVQNTSSEHRFEASAGFKNQSFPLKDVHTFDNTPTPNMRTRTEHTNGTSSRRLFTLRLGLHEIVEFNDAIPIHNSTSRISLHRDMCDWSALIFDQFTVNNVSVTNVTSTCVAGKTAIVFTAYLASGPVTLKDGTNLTASNWKHSISIASFEYQYENSYLAIVEAINTNETVTGAYDTYITIGTAGKVSWTPTVQVDGGEYVPIEGNYDPEYVSRVIQIDDVDPNAVEGENIIYMVYIVKYMQPAYVFWDPEISIDAAVAASDLIISTAAESLPLDGVTSQALDDVTMNNSTGSAPVLRRSITLPILITFLVALLM